MDSDDMDIDGSTVVNSVDSDDDSMISNADSDEVRMDADSLDTDSEEEDYVSTLFDIDDGMEEAVTDLFRRINNGEISMNNLPQEYTNIVRQFVHPTFTIDQDYINARYP
jgi:hypothetical protein